MDEGKGARAVGEGAGEGGEERMRRGEGREEGEVERVLCGCGRGGGAVQRRIVAWLAAVEGSLDASCNSTLV